MRTPDRIVLIYTMSLIGAGAFAFWRGKRGKDLYVDMAFHGAVVGTAVNVLTWFVSASLQDKPAAIPLQRNPGLLGSLSSLAGTADTMSKMGERAKNLIGKIDVDNLYAPFSESGVEVGPVPANEYTVTQKRNRKN